MSSLGSMISRLWAPVSLSSASIVIVTFAINFLSVGKTAWWWLVLAVGAVGLTVSAIWIYRAQGERSGGSPPGPAVQKGAGDTQQASSGRRSTNIAINADNGSAAAWRMETVNVGRPPRGRKPKKR